MIQFSVKVSLPMEYYYCQPCKSQSNDNNATVWCRDCEQLLCEACRAYHKVLKITKDHVLIKTEDYLDIADFLELLNTKCEFHSETEITYHCPTHAKMFCILCKIDNHKNCSDIQLIEEVTTDDKYSRIEMFSEKVYERISILDSIGKDRMANIERLDNQREQFIKDLKNNREKINLALDDLELELKAKFEVGYQFEKRRTEGELDSCNKTKAHWQKEYDQLVKINQHKPLSDVQLYLAERHLLTHNAKEDTKVKDFVESISETSLECCLSLDISKSNRSITINDNIKVTSFKPKFDSNVIMEKKFKVQIIENCVTDSSTIEEEKIIQEDNKNNLQNDIQDQDDKHVVETVTQSKTISDSNKKKDDVSESYQFIYSNHFTIIKSDNQTIISCVKNLPNGDLMFGEESRSRLLIYDKTGDKKGQIELKSIPESLAIIDKERVAVTAGKAISIVKFNTLHIDKTFVQGDNCYGVAFMNDTLLVNCKTKGLRVLDLSGVLRKTFNSVKGILYMTAIDPDTLIYVKRGSQLVNFFNIATKCCISYKCPNLKEVTGITTDTNKNVYMSCHESDKIYMLRFGSEKWQTILTQKDEIFQPECIDFHEDVLYIINDGRVIYSYRQKKLTRYQYAMPFNAK